LSPQCPPETPKLDIAKMECTKTDDRHAEASKPKACLSSKYKLITFRWRQELKSYEALRCINTIKGNLLDDHPSEGDSNVDYELVVACAAKLMQLKLTAGYEAWYVSPWPGPDHIVIYFPGVSKENFLTPRTPISIAYRQRGERRVLFEGTRSWLKARRKKWRTDAGVQDSVDYKACFERLAARSPEVAMRVLTRVISTLLRRTSRAQAQVLKYRRQNQSSKQLHGGWSQSIEQQQQRGNHSGSRRGLERPPVQVDFLRVLRVEDKE
jgi:hypothetical protein